ncbi:MAG: YdcF family protein [Bacteroidota bacterium]
MKARLQSSKFIIIIFLSLANLISLSYLKYKMNDLELTSYTLDYVGNILNILIALVHIAGLLIIAFRKASVDKNRINFILFINAASVVSLLIVYLINTIIPIDAKEYLLSFPVKKVYTGFLFISSYFMNIYSMIYIWGMILGFEKLFELRALLRTVFAILILMIFSLFVVWNVKIYDEKNLMRNKYEYGLIPGAAVWSKAKPSPIFEGRIRKAYDLYKKGIIDKIVLTGGNAPGEITEAEAAEKLLLSLSVHKNKMIIENQTQQTNEQIKYIKFDPTITQSGKPVLIISDNFHLTRVLQICKFFDVKAEGISSGHTLTFEKTIFYRTRESVALLLFWLFGI